MDERFPFNRGAKAGLGLIAISMALIGWSVVPAIANSRQPAIMPLMAAIMLMGVALLVVVWWSIEPSRRHYRETRRYLLPGKGGPVETRYATVAWGVLGSFIAMGLSLIALGIWGAIALGA